MEHELQLIQAASRQHSLLTRTMVRDLGVSEARWIGSAATKSGWRSFQACGDMPRHHPPGSWRCAAGSLWLGKEAGLHAAAALRWLGVEGFEDATADFLVPRSRRYIPPWLNIHTTAQWSRGDFVRKDGVLCSTATRAIIDLAATATPRVVESAIDSAIRHAAHFGADLDVTTS